ncbi:hypothetical protein MPDQ_008046 [Monascus purpureus]|uniref:Uncharacterized protein n=1 Tax=Monascus purpureus TaxID=5098 RepID=A0A507QQT8_MONPU|nr:hypothetical protein MPDQ_008046 [Monascus purpureus]
MLSSPAKRRKTNNAPDTDASHTNQVPPDRNVDSQSHPEIPAHDTGQSDGQRGQAEGRAFGLRDRKALRPSLTSTASPARGPRLSGSSTLLSPARRSSSLQAFAVPPRRVSRKILPSDFTFGSPTRLQNTSQRTRRENAQLASELESIMTGIEDDGEDFTHSTLYGGVEEPELPPTPTQLGLEQPPGRPTGNLSNSPSGRKRGKRQTIDPIQPSPLVFEDSIGLTGKAEDLSMKEITVGRELVPETILKKRRLRAELLSELNQLRNDVEGLENWVDKSKSPNERDEAFDTETLRKLVLPFHEARAARTANLPLSSLISSLLPFSPKVPLRTTQHSSASLENPFALQDSTRTTPYLTVFAPLALTESSKASASKPDILTETHELTLSAPPPFPRRLYSVTVTYESNPETQSVISVSLSPDITHNGSRILEVLQNWAESRLANPLLKLDISGLCWGINRYWEAVIYRAQIWSNIESKYSKWIPGRGRLALFDESNKENSRPSSQKGSSSGPTTITRPQFLISHIERTSALFASNEKLPKVLLSCLISLDEWTGEPQLRPEISISSPSPDKVSGRKIEQETKKLFRALLNDKGAPGTDGAVGDSNPDAIARAIGGVLGVLFGADSNTARPASKRKALGKE